MQMVKMLKGEDAGAKLVELLQQALGPLAGSGGAGPSGAAGADGPATASASGHVPTIYDPPTGADMRMLYSAQCTH